MIFNLETVFFALVSTDAPVSVVPTLMLASVSVPTRLIAVDTTALLSVAIFADTSSAVSVFAVALSAPPAEMVAPSAKFTVAAVVWLTTFTTAFMYDVASSAFAF